MAHPLLPGHLDAHRAAWLCDWVVDRHPDSTTLLESATADQAQLHGLLESLRDLGAPLLAVATVGCARLLVALPLASDGHRADRGAVGARDDRERHRYVDLLALGAHSPRVPGAAVRGEVAGRHGPEEAPVM